MAIKANITIDQGTDFEAIIDVSDTSGNPFNMGGYSAASQMRKNYASSSPAAAFSAVHNGVAGQITLSLSKNFTTDLEPGRYLYDVEITSPSGTTTRVVEGTVTVTPGITRI